MSTPNELQRYVHDYEQMSPDDAGSYVLFSDIEPLIRSHEALRNLSLALDRMTHSSDWLPGDKQRALWAAREEAKAALAAAKEAGKPC